MDSSQLPPPQLPSLSDLESRMQVMRVSALEENQTGETFSERAEWFYQRRPQLLSLCQDLYDGYTTLLDRFNHENDSDTTDISSEVSFQQTACDSSFLAANSDKDMELRCREEKLGEASKTIELLKKLVMLLDMEREVAVEEATKLGYKIAALLEENRELATEALFMKNEAVRLARCVLRMRDEHFHKVCVLENRIDELQSSRESVYEKVSSPSCFGIGLDSDNNKSKKRKMSEASGQGEKKKRSKWLKRLNPFTKCNLTPSSSSPLA